MTPERKAALDWQRGLFPCGKTLPEICVALREGVNGSADAWDPMSVQQAVSMLEARLATWEPTPKAHGYRAYQFDEAVRGLVYATVSDVRDRDWWCGP